MSTATIPSTQACAVCQQEATQRCSRCKQTWYCSTEHQKQDWKRHKAAVCDDAYQADQYTLHKQEFDRIIKKYNLNTEAQSSAIAEFLTAGEAGSVTAAQFAEKFGTTPEEAVVFWSGFKWESSSSNNPSMWRPNLGSLLPSGDGPRAFHKCKEAGKYKIIFSNRPNNERVKKLLCESLGIVLYEYLFCLIHSADSSRNILAPSDPGSSLHITITLSPWSCFFCL